MLSYEFNWSVIWTEPYGTWMLQGIWTTISLGFISWCIALTLGIIIGTMRITPWKPLRIFATAYTEFFRDIPLLVQLFFWYFAFPTIIQGIGRSLNIDALAHYQADALLMAVFGLTLCYAAYMTEIYRAGIQSISRGQMEAARSLGMTYVQAMRYIILPQAARVILPPVGNEFISMLKDSSLVSTVAIADLTRLGREYSGAHFIPLQVWSLVALIYLVMTLFSARVVSWLERKTRIER